MFIYLNIPDYQNTGLYLIEYVIVKYTQTHKTLHLPHRHTDTHTLIDLNNQLLNWISLVRGRADCFKFSKKSFSVTRDDQFKAAGSY